MEIRHLKLVKTVAESGTLTRAADTLFLTQSALSHQLKEIEEKCGMQVFTRIKKQMVLTPVGERLLQTANNVLSEMERSESDIKNLVSGDSGVLRIATQCYTCYHWLSPFLKDFSSKYPNVEIKVVAEATLQPLPYLERGEIDIALLNYKPDNRLLTAKKLFTDELVAIVPPSHRWKGRKHVMPAELAEECYIMYPVDTSQSVTYNQVFTANEVAPRKIIRMQLTEAIVEMVKAGMGMAILAKWAVKPYLKNKEVMALPITRKGFVRTWYAATSSNKTNPPYLDYLVSYMAKQMI